MPKRTPRRSLLISSPTLWPRVDCSRPNIGLRRASRGPPISPTGRFRCRFATGWGNRRTRTTAWRRYVPCVTAAEDESWLVTGPRGRRLCWELLGGPAHTRAWGGIWYETALPDALVLAAELSERIDRWLA